MFMEKNIKCNNCNSNRFQFKARGYCNRCYPLVRKIEIIKLWNFDDTKTLKYYPKDGIFYNKKNFNEIKKGFIEQYKERLNHLKVLEQILNSDICGSNIVSLFRRIAKLAGLRNKDILWHQEDLFDRNFTPKQRKIIYKILNDIEESITWKGINWYKIFSKK